MNRRNSSDRGASKPKKYSKQVDASPIRQSPTPAGAPQSRPTYRIDGTEPVSPIRGRCAQPGQHSTPVYDPVYDTRLRPLGWRDHQLNLVRTRTNNYYDQRLSGQERGRLFSVFYKWGTRVLRRRWELLLIRRDAIDEGSSRGATGQGSVSPQRIGGPWTDIVRRDRCGKSSRGGGTGHEGAAADGRI